MDFDNTPPFDLADYRHMQKAIPGVDGFYTLVRAIAETAIARKGRILIVGAGGGRELEVLGPSDKTFAFTAVDPSTGMLDTAKACAAVAGAAERTEFIAGLVDDVPADAPFDAATSLLVMHFLPDDGTKLAYLSAIRDRMKPGAVLIHADVCLDGTGMFRRTVPSFLRHAVLAGLSEEQAALGPDIISGMPTIGERRTRQLFREAGFTGTTLFYTGLWYRGWTCRAA
ncbi:class I SAM-dependent methyltransferase [Eilatimonas milleporae]|uniref:tRNA (Cmo5U34)-methyltransferase n=1 Tax=Eilatimonas milleporae TaxID=911205 RepID=A0A3M0CVZ0_9PROT|nr:class I SAM-dependent methyltransferase [Eilatimonas milleporae]RMB13015.1 tRNA (cmo5U34)-methyltransferase [Eilatimonas milleporae]